MRFNLSKWRRNPTSESSDSLQRITTSDLRIIYPATLCELNTVEKQADCVLTFCQMDEGGFRPSIVFSSRDTEDPLVDCVYVEQQRLIQEHPNTCLLMMLPYAKPSEDGEDLDYVGFQTTSSYFVDDHALIVKRWDFSTGQKHLTATASFLPSQMLRVETTFRWVVDNLEFSAPQATLVAAAQRQSRTGAPIDSEVSQRLGVPVLNQQGFPHSKVQQSRYYSAADMGQPLEDLGADIRGSHLLDVVLTTRGMEGNYQVVRGSSGPVVVRTASDTADDPLVYQSGHPKYAAYLCSIELILSDVLGWLGAVPNYTYSDEFTLSSHELEQKLAHPVLGQAWKRFEIYTDSAKRAWLAIPGKDAFYEQYPADLGGEIKLRSIPHFYVVDTMAEVIGSAL